MTSSISAATPPEIPLIREISAFHPYWLDLGRKREGEGVKEYEDRKE